MIFILFIKKVVSVLLAFAKYLCMLTGIAFYFMLHSFVGQVGTYMSRHASGN